MKNILFLFVFGFTAAQSVTVTYNVFVDGTGFVSKKKEVLDIMASYVKICNETKVELVFSDNKASFLVLPNTTPTLDQEDVAIAISGFVTGQDYYTDLTTKKVYCKRGDGTFTVGDLSSFAWELLDETKIIDQFTCYKALLKQDRTDSMGKKIVVITEAWYAPSLPYAFGPKEYSGLPGLILELKNKRTTFVAAKITKLENAKPIEFPKGPFVDAVEYERKLRALYGL